MQHFLFSNLICQDSHLSVRARWPNRSLYLSPQQVNQFDSYLHTNTTFIRWKIRWALTVSDFNVVSLKEAPRRVESLTPPLPHHLTVVAQHRERICALERGRVWQVWDIALNSAVPYHSRKQNWTELTCCQPTEGVLKPARVRGEISHSGDQNLVPASTCHRLKCSWILNKLERQSGQQALKLLGEYKCWTELGANEPGGHVTNWESSQGN